MGDLNSTIHTLYQTSVGIFWSALPVAMLLCMLGIYSSGEISGARFENLFRRLLISILLLVGFHQISSVFLDLESYLVQAFGGDSSLALIFSRVGDRASNIKNSASGSWFKIGEMGLSIISTLSFLILAVVKRFLDVLHLSIWNLMHVLGPIALLGCLSPTFSSIPKGIFLGMLEISLWKPFWVILSRILLSVGFNEAPTDPSQWFDTAVLNFAIAGLMATTPALVHSFLSGQLASIGGSAIQTMIGGAGVAMARAPVNTMQALSAPPKRAIANTGHAIKQWAGRKLNLSKKETQKPKKGS